MKHESNRFVTWKTYLCPKEHTYGQIGITLRTDEETARSRCTDEGHLRRDGHSIQRTLLALFFRAPHLHQSALRRMRYGKCVRPRAATSQQRVETQTARLPRRIVRQSATSNHVSFPTKTADDLFWTTSRKKPSNTCPMPASIPDFTSLTVLRPTPTD